MRPLSVHWRSAFAGAGLLGAILLVAGAAQVPLPPREIPAGVGLTRVAGIPDPREMVVVREGTPYIVPPGRLLAITGLGGTNHLGPNTLEVTLRVDGIDEVEASVRLPYGNGTTVADLPQGFSVREGSSVEVLSTTGDYGCAWGYLAEAAGHGSGVVRIAGIPDPRSMVVIREAELFEVPAGKLLVLTGLGGTAGGTTATLKVDGAIALVAASNWSAGNSSSVCAVPPGLSLPAGSTVAVESSTVTLGRAWGYLSDA